METFEIYTTAKGRIPSQREQILDMLRKAGDKGVTNLQLQRVGVRWNARIQELYRMGYKIENDTYLGDGIYTYILVSEPDVLKTANPIKARDILFNTISNDYNGQVTLEQLQQILANENLNIMRNHNYFK